MSQSPEIGIIGAGVMGQALIRGMLSSQRFQENQIWATVRTDETLQKVKALASIDVLTTLEPKKVSDADAILLCVKPYQVEAVIEKLKKSGLKESTLLISICAGVNLEKLQNHALPNQPVIRAMPNTPAVIQKGMSVLCSGKKAEKKHLELAHEVFSSVGDCTQIEESLFDSVTGLGGSGPAYMFLIMEALIDGGVRVGLPRETAKRIILQTVLGSAEMMKTLGNHPAALRDQVTTPAGCTIAGLLIMEDGKIRSVLARAVEEAARTAGQLNKKS